MLTLSDIAIAINDKLTEVLPHIKIQTKDISEGFERPCLYVDFENVSNAAFGASGRERQIHVIIYFFSSDRYQNKIEILETQEILEQAFTGHLVIKEGFFVYPFEVNSTKVDGILQFSFDVHCIEIDDSEIDSEIGEDMEELTINIVKGN